MNYFNSLKGTPGTIKQTIRLEEAINQLRQQGYKIREIAKIFKSEDSLLSLTTNTKI